MFLAGALILVAIVAGLATFFTTPQKIAFDWTVRLSNSAYLRLTGTRTEGPDSGDNWEAQYRDGSVWETAGTWWGGDWNGGNDGNILACPLGRLVVIVKSNGSEVFVRGESGTWKEFLMTLPLPSPADPSHIGPQMTSLETAEVLSILKQMSVPPASGSIHPEVVGFQPEKRELWLDYVSNTHRLYRVRLALLESGGKFRLVSVEGRPNTLHSEFPGVPDPALDPTCTTIQFTSGLRE